MANRTQSAYKLSLVAPGEELTGAGPADFERLGRTAKPRSTDHIGLIAISVTLAQRAARVCVPPSAQSELGTALSTAQGWVRSLAQHRNPGVDERSARENRARLFSALPAIEQATARAIQKACAELHHPSEAGLDQHAKLTTLRFCRLAAHHATAAVCHCLDALEKPAEALHIPSDSAGALAYQAAALGSARHRTFRQAAVEQARWESAHAGDVEPHGSQGLALFIFHEYLGARWKSHADLQRQLGDEFIAWAMSGRASPGACHSDPGGAAKQEVPKQAARAARRFARSSSKGQR